jgi:hypothetical protein
MSARARARARVAIVGRIIAWKTASTYNTCTREHVHGRSDLTPTKGHDIVAYHQVGGVYASPTKWGCHSGIPTKGGGGSFRPPAAGCPGCELPLCVDSLPKPP